jgi:hypothetical protein
MSRISALTLALAALTLAAAISAPACVVEEADDDANPTGGGGSGGAGAGGEGGQNACNTEDPDACQACLAGTCCDAVVACQGDAPCWACVTGADGTQCAANPTSHELATAYLECMGGPCNDTCIGATGSCEEASSHYEEACGACLETSCCDQLGACYAHEGCWVDCVTMHNEAGCHEPSAHALFYALGQCAQTSCNAECIAGPQFEPACTDVPAVAPSGGSCVTLGGNNACNPLTNEGCDAGEACDVNQAGNGFACFPPPNTQPLCEACGEQEGYCAPGHTCAGSCVRFCCDDADCGPSGSCDDTILNGLLGLCVVEEG